MRKGHLEVVELLLEHGIDWRIHGNRFETPLNVASSFGHLEVFNKLLEVSTDRELALALHSAVENNQNEVRKYKYSIHTS